MTILLYKNGQWLIDGEQPLEGVSLDNLAAILTNPKDGDVVKYDETSGMWVAGDALPPVSSSDNGKVLTVEDGAWAAQGDIVLNATVSYDDSNQNYALTITSALPSSSDLEACFNSNRSITLVIVGTGWIARLQPGLRETDQGTVLYTFVGRGLSFDDDKLRFVLRFRVESSVVSYFGKVYINNKFLVTLTPTALDYSGTMDKTVAKINAAYEAGMEIVFRFVTGANTHYAITATNIDKESDDYPSFSGFALLTENLVQVYTHSTMDGTDNTYGTAFYSLTPASRE